jgi:hypothetical protein
VLPWGWALTGKKADLNDYNCPLALPSNLTYLSVEWLECSQGSLWRHVAPCTALQELELQLAVDAAHSHPSWGLHELAGSLGRLRKLVIKHEGMKGQGNALHCLADLLRLLYLPGEDAGPEELDAALALAVPPMLIPGSDMSEAPHHIMLPSPNMAQFSSLEVLQLPGKTHDSWWLICCAPHHWQALAGCRRLKQLEGLHASQPPPPGVKFPGVTRLAVTVAPGDVFQVLGAFPALVELSITSMFEGDTEQVGC